MLFSFKLDSSDGVELLRKCFLLQALKITIGGRKGILCFLVQKPLPFVSNQSIKYDGHKCNKGTKCSTKLTPNVIRATTLE